MSCRLQMPETQGWRRIFYVSRHRWAFEWAMLQTQGFFFVAGIGLEVAATLVIFDMFDKSHRSGVLLMHESPGRWLAMGCAPRGLAKQPIPSRQLLSELAADAVAGRWWPAPGRADGSAASVTTRFLPKPPPSGATPAASRRVAAVLPAMRRRSTAQSLSRWRPPTRSGTLPARSWMSP